VRQIAERAAERPKSFGRWLPRRMRPGAARLPYEKAAAGTNQRRLSRRHRDHQTGHDEQQPWTARRS